MQSFPVMSGTQLQLEFTVKDRAGAAIDLTGGAGLFRMARSPTAALIDIDSGASPPTATITVISAPTGRVNVIITDELTDPLLGDYYYEFRWADSAGRSVPTARGWQSFAANLT